MLSGTFQINVFKKKVIFDIAKGLLPLLIYFNFKLELLDIIYIPSGKLVANCLLSPFLNIIKHPYDFENTSKTQMLRKKNYKGKFLNNS